MNIETIRHSLSHVLAAAILELYPDTKLGIGPAIDNGYYYDFLFTNSITPEDLQKIEKKMREIINQKLPFERKEFSSDEAIEQLNNAKQNFKVELAEELTQKNEPISFYTLGNFTDLCAGPHVENTADLKEAGWNLDKLAGAYWRGDEKNPMLTRIYGLAFSSKDELDQFIKNREEAEKRDHRRLGKELGLFVFSELIGPGLPLYTPKGATLRGNIANYSRELRREIGYMEVHTPNINKAELFKISGHYDKYKDDMLEVHSHYTDEEYYLKPMNCPQHTQIYASESRSYRDLPIRIADFANLYRDEKPGELSGLTRLRCFCQDDGHCFCREDQIAEEFGAILGVIHKAMDRYGLSYHIRLSLRDEAKKESYLGDDEIWQKSQKLLEDLLIEKKIDYIKAEGEAAFYGPKMDLMVKDSLGRQWQLSTVQVDFNMPIRFGLEYVDESGEKKTPVMIHSAITGSPERFMGILIEHYAGAFPSWLAPVQAIILPIADRHLEYAAKVRSELLNAGIRVDLDSRSESIGKKIRESELKKIPYMLIIGDKEIEAGKVALRQYREGDKGQITVEEFISLIK